MGDEGLGLRILDFQAYTPGVALYPWVWGSWGATLAHIRAILMRFRRQSLRFREYWWGEFLGVNIRGTTLEPLMLAARALLGPYLGSPQV